LAAQLAKLRHGQMKRLLRIFDLSKSEQRVVLIVMMILIAVTFLGYERRVHQSRVQPTSATEPKASPNAADLKDN
jgi:hypothetical protein